MELSIVSTLYRSEQHLAQFIERMLQTAKSITEDFEIILVNDGSPDRSIDIALQFHEQDPRVKVIDLSRNFGHHRAIMAGLGQCSGRYVFLIDCDLEEDPELLPEFYRRMSGQDEVDVYYGVQSRRKGGLIERLGGKLFYFMFNSLTRMQLHEALLTVRIMTRRYVRALLAHPEQEVFLAALFELTGFRQESVTVEKHQREGSSYNFARRFRLMVTGITAFSSFPLLVSFYAGSVISAGAMAYAIYLVILKLADPGLIVEGWTSLMISVWFLGGVILISCGLLGLYLSRIYNEVKRRPNYIVRRTYGIPDEGPTN